MLGPADGAGSGAQRYLISDTIIEVEGGGISTCETSLIQSVDKTPPTTYDCRVLNGTFGDTPDSWDSLPPSPRYDGVAIGTKPTADTGIYMGLVYKIDVPGFIRINPNAGGADASIPVKLWSSNDGINWVGPTEVTQGNLDPSHASYDASIGFSGQYGCIQRQGGTNIAAWYPTGSEALTTLTFPDTQGFECFSDGDVVQDLDVKIISKDADSSPPTITVDGGEWYAPTGTAGQEYRWSSFVTISAGDYYPGDGPENMFDETPNTVCNAADTSATVTFTPPNPITFTSTVEFYGGSGNGIKLWNYNTGKSDEASGQYSTQEWHTVATGGGTFETLSFNGNSIAYIAVENIRVDGVVLIDAPEGDSKLTKSTSYDTKLTVDSDKDLADMTGATFMSDGAGAPGPYTQTPYKLVTSEITNVDEVVNDFQGLISDWQLVDILTAAHYPSSNGPFDSVDNNYAYFYDSSSQVPISNRTTARAYIDLLEVAEGSDIEVAWQGSRGNYASTILQLLDKDGNVVLQTGFNNPTDNQSAANKVSVGKLSSSITRLQLRIDQNQGTTAQVELLGGFAGLYVNGNKYVAGTYKESILTFADPNPDLRYFLPGDEVQAGVSVVSTDPDNNKMVVDGGEWDESDHREVWSNYFTNWVPVENVTNGIPSAAFDNLERNDFSNSENTLMWNYTPGYDFTDKVEIFYYRTEGKVRVNNGSEIDLNADNWTTVLSGGGTLNTIEMTYGYGGKIFSFAILRIDGKVLIDRGDKDDIWRNYGSGNQYDSAYSWESVFDGVGSFGGFPAANDSITWAPTGGLEFDTSFSAECKVSYKTFDTAEKQLPVIIAEFETAGTVEIKRNDDQFIGASESLVKLADGPDKLISVSFINPGSAASAACSVLKLFKDGKQLIDADAFGQGLDKVEYQTKGGKGTIVSVNTDDNTLLIADATDGDRDNRWIAENKADTDFYVAGPSVTDDPLLTADVELKSSNFATTPADADTLKNIVWELNGVTQDAGTSNPYKPTGLALNTEYTVRVKHQGNSLPDSAWSTSTTFTTGATRNLYTYYNERIAALVTRIEELEGGA